MGEIYDTVILGAGLAGLAAAYHLDNDNYIILEKENQIGGLCASKTVENYIFDFGTHTFFTQDQYVTELLNDLLPEPMVSHKREAYVYMNGHYIKYPFETNLHALAPEIIDKCIKGIKSRDPTASSDNFEQWLLNSFGDGIASLYMVPYARKIWKYPLERMDIDWIGDKVPGATIEDVIKGSKGELDKEFGFNIDFSYPKEDGFAAIPNAFAGSLKNINTNSKILKLELTSTNNSNGVLLKVRTDGRVREITTDSVIATIPLPDLVYMINDVPVEIKKAAEKLNYTHLLSIGLGVARENISDKHWLYFPEQKYIFNRVSFPMNLSRSTTPPCKSSILAEVTFEKGTTIDISKTQERVIEGLVEAGILITPDEVEVISASEFKYAYVIHDLTRQRNVNIIHEFLVEHNIIAAGRWGEWKYFNLDKTIQSGRKAAIRINNC